MSHLVSSYRVNPHVEMIKYVEEQKQEEQKCLGF